MCSKHGYIHLFIKRIVMALKFKLVMRKNLGEDHESIPEKVYAQMVYGDLVTFDEFAEEVADSSGVGSASVKAVLDRMNVVLVRHLQHGRGFSAFVSDRRGCRMRRRFRRT